MSGPPSQIVYEKKEVTTRRRLDIAKYLRAHPKATNIEIGKALGVAKEQVAYDRKMILKQLRETLITETEEYRAEMFSRLESLVEEVEKHRDKDGKLSLAAIDSLLDITKAAVELVGCRKPVVEQKQVKKSGVIQFAVSYVPTRRTPFAQAEIVPELLEAGTDEES